MREKNQPAPFLSIFLTNADHFGSHKGKRLFAPKKLPVRPTTDRSKEALFNILQHQYDWSSIRVLDLFAGTGNISYEFSSRGVNEVFSVDKNSHCIKFIKQTAEKT